MFSGNQLSCLLQGERPRNQLCTESFLEILKCGTVAHFAVGRSWEKGGVENTKEHLKKTAVRGDAWSQHAEESEEGEAVLVA